MDRLKPTTTEARIAGMLEAIEARRPALAQVMDTHGSKSLAEYVETFPQNEAEPIHPRSDVIEAAANKTRALLGDELAEKLTVRLNEKPVILTANHHGPDFMHITVQGNMVKALSEPAGSVLPIFAFSNVPLNNMSYARGIALSREQEVQTGKDPKTGQPIFNNVTVKVPLHPGSTMHSLVHVANPLTADHIREGRKKTTDMNRKKQISQQEHDALQSVLSIYESDAVLSQTSFSDQSTVVNHGLWKMQFAPDIRERVPEMVMLNIEELTVDILEKDFENPDSFMYNILFNPNLRASVVADLSGVYGCWGSKGGEQNEGTAFFWKIDDKGKRVAMTFTDDQARIQPVGSETDENAISLTPDAIIKGLKEKTIMPGLFASFATIAFARGFKCYGGFMQTDYLTNMSQGISQSLRSNGYDQWADKVGNVPTANYATGMTFAVARYNGDIIRPAGALEIIAKGGLTEDDVRQIQSVSVRDANLLGLPETYPKIVKQEHRDPEIERLTSHDVYQTVKGTLVEIPID